MAATSNRSHGGGDRLSALADATLARVLSHLPTGEAVRCSVLSRRWRCVHTTVPVVSLVDRKRSDGGKTNDKPVCFDHQVTSALICRDPRAPIRALRLDVFHPTISLLDQWIIIVLNSGAEEVDVKLSYYNSYYSHRLCPFGPYEESSADFDYQHIGRFIKTPRQLFRSSTLRRLCLTNWTLDLPSGDVPSFMSLEVLALKKIMARDGVLQRLVSSCPRLSDLTLEECPTATEVSATGAHLQNFAMVCCHKTTCVVLGTRCLRTLRYKGSLPDASFISLANHATVAAVTVDICEKIDQKTPHEVGNMAKFINRCANLTFLHLGLRPQMVMHRNLFTTVLRGLPRLRQLELQGCLLNYHSVASTIALLQNTNNLEELSLFPLPPDPPKMMAYCYDSDLDLPNDGNEDCAGSGGGKVYVPKSLWRTNVRCLNNKVRRIRLVGYRGGHVERILAKFLLSKAAVLDEIFVSIPLRRFYTHEDERARDQLTRKDEMTRELMSWRCNGRAKFTCA